MNAPTRLAESAALAASLATFADRAWDERIVPALTDYIAVPAKSPMFDADWVAHGYLDRVVRDAATWVEGRRLPGLKLEVVRLEGRTPVIFFELPASAGRAGPEAAAAGSGDTVLLYGHLDKQPEFSGWRPGLGPWTPRYDNGLLYGRGGADDGYALFSSIAAIRALREQGIPHARCVVLIEASEESGSPDLPAHIDALGTRLGLPSLVVCLDAECGNYEQLWCTTSLRGNLIGTFGAHDLEFQLGFSHPVLVKAPEGITFAVESPVKFKVQGIDKQKVGEVAANIRKIRKPEPYKGKGVRYEGEVVRRKAGKAGK